MRNWDFHMGEVVVRISANDDEPIELNIHRFAYNSSNPDVVVNLRSVDEISIPVGTKCNSPQEHPVWINDDEISRLSWDFFREKPHMRVDYDLQMPGVLACDVRSEYLKWAVSEKYLWAGIGLQYILLHHNHLIFHASYIEVHGKGMIFIAPSGTGKSTQANLWKMHRGADIINGDKACVSVSESPTVHGIPFDGTSGICQDVSRPLACIVVLSQGDDNTVSRLTTTQAIQSLFSNVFVDRSVPYEWNKALELVIKLIEKVPVFHLKCTPDVAAVEALESAMCHEI